MLWDKLGIEPTDDEQKIKEAFARQSKLYHPEDSPEEFKELYNAYKTILSNVKRKNKQKLKQEKKVQTNFPDNNKEPILGKLNNDKNEHLNKDKKEQNKLQDKFLIIEKNEIKNKKKLMQKLAELLEVSNMERPSAESAWKIFFSDKYLLNLLLEDKKFTDTFLEKITHAKVYEYDMWRKAIYDQIIKIADNWRKKEDGATCRKAEILLRYAHVHDMKLSKERIDKYRKQKENRERVAKFFVVFVLVGMFFAAMFGSSKSSVQSSNRTMPDTGANKEIKEFLLTNKMPKETENMFRDSVKLKTDYLQIGGFIQDHNMFYVTDIVDEEVKVGIVDIYGTEIIKPEYDELWLYGKPLYYREVLFVAVKDDKCGIVGQKNGIIIPFEYDLIREMKSYSEYKMGMNYFVVYPIYRAIEEEPTDLPGGFYPEYVDLQYNVLDIRGELIYESPYIFRLEKETNDSFKEYYDDENFKEYDASGNYKKTVDLTGSYGIKGVYNPDIYGWYSEGAWQKYEDIEPYEVVQWDDKTPFITNLAP